MSAPFTTWRRAFQIGVILGNNDLSNDMRLDYMRNIERLIQHAAGAFSYRCSNNELADRLHKLYMYI